VLYTALLGGSVAGAGDVYGDGYSDVIVGAWTYDDGQTDEGRAWIWYGNEGYGGLVRKLQQRTRTGARPIAVVGSSGQSGLFRIRCEFTSQSAGYSWASPAAPVTWLEWEIKPHGVPFDGTAIQRGEEYPLVPAALVVFDELASVDDATGHARTTEARSYHWRARVATNNPLFPNSAWFSVQGNNVTEAKLRKPRRQGP
jgi:hypothetical protein